MACLRALRVALRRLIPVSALTEVRSGLCGPETLSGRLINAIGAEEDLHLRLNLPASSRAGVLRAEVQALTRRDTSAADAQVVALVKERSVAASVTIITGEPRDTDLLVGLTRRTNIAVDVVR